MRRARQWAEISAGAQMRIPRIFKFVLTWVTPVFLLVLMGWWTVQDAIPTLLMKGKPEQEHLVRLGIPRPHGADSGPSALAHSRRLAAARCRGEARMTASALVFMVSAWAFVLGLTFWSFWKLLRVDPSHEHLPPPGTSL